MAMTPPQSALASCSDSEKALILIQLLDGDPTLRRRAEDIARRMLGSVEITTVSDLIVEALLGSTSKTSPTARALADTATSSPPTQRGSSSRRRSSPGLRTSVGEHASASTKPRLT
jgi:hypothetical protein